ncbi:DNA polymerase III subunit delta [Fodinisporobacter ferrooxydans]|uniref:DNA polymerase III subunit delta n=1 Tax=Fodinisporobacter ferrooxydans TaxID=2901836 RepID=A0ABY4CQT2_9BACL|nr:DNA polymerase III subunit delta [Alicyclobacillaceae bacterium MYW30-H2]
MHFHDLWKTIQQKNKEIAPIYLLYGTETGFMHKVISAIQKRLFGEETTELLASKFDYEDTAIQSILLEAETLPFFGERRLIVVDRFSAVTAQKQSTLDHHLDELLRYLDNPSPYTVLVLLAHTEKLDERKKISKKFLANAIVCSCQPMKMDECKEWVMEYCRQEHVNISKETTETLVQYAGTDITALEHELEKMILYAADTKTIAESDLLNLVSKSAEQNIFTFIDHLVRLRLEKAWEALHDLLLRKEAPIYLLFMIARQYRLILQTMLQSERGYSQQQIASQLGVHPYGVKIAYEQGKTYRKKQLECVLSQLAEIDYRIKTGKEQDRMALERFILLLPQLLHRDAR